MCGQEQKITIFNPQNNIVHGEFEQKPLRSEEI